MTIIQSTDTETLVIKAQNGDRHAYGELVCAHSQGVLNIVYRMCGNRDLAEDATQEAFIRAWLKLSSYRPKISFKSWLYRIAVNAALDMLRKEKHILSNTVEDLKLRDTNPGPEAVLVKNEQADLIFKAVATLPDASRSVLILKEYESFSYQEIAETLEIPIGTVMSRLNYARKLLKGKLETQLFVAMEDKK